MVQSDRATEPTARTDAAAQNGCPDPGPGRVDDPATPAAAFAQRRRHRSSVA